VRVCLEIGINEVRILARLAVQLDRIGPVDFVYIGAIAPPYRDPSNWFISTRLDNIHNADFCLSQGHPGDKGGMEADSRRAVTRRFGAPLHREMAGGSGRDAYRQRGAAMDQVLLVNEQFEAGKRFLEELDKYIPVRAAFWLKINEGPFGR
jgi:hypothetical protein